MYGFTPPPRQANLPRVEPQYTEKQTFNDTAFARVDKITDLKKTGKVEVLFLNRTKPAPVWVLDGPDPVVGDFVLIGYINGQKNNPYIQGIVRNKAWTSNFITVTDKMIRIQFPTVEKDITGDPTKENDPKSHLQDDTQLETRGYLQIDKTGMKINVPAGLPLTILADSAVLQNHATGHGLVQPKNVALAGDPVNVNVSVSITTPDGTFTGTGTGTGMITSGSSRLKTN